MVGVYVIKNKIDGKKYYGSSKDISKRWERHKNDLNNNRHHNIKLQRAWNKYGVVNFVFEIIEECEHEQLLITEQKYLNQKPEYNIGLSASGGDNLSNNPKKEKIIEKIKKAVKNRFNNLNADEKKVLSKNLSGEHNPNWKGGSSIKYCDCGKKISPNNKTCIKCRNIKGENNPNYGKNIPDEHKKYLRDLFRGRCLHNNNKEITIDETNYSSFKEAEKNLGINWGTIRFRVLSKNPKYVNYNFKGEKKDVYTKKEQKERFAKSKKGKQTNFSKPFTIDGIEYRTLKEASDMLGIHQMTIKGRLKSEKFGNYIYKV